MCNGIVANPEIKILQRYHLNMKQESLAGAEQTLAPHRSEPSSVENCNDIWTPADNVHEVEIACVSAFFFSWYGGVKCG